MSKLKKSYFSITLITLLTLTIFSTSILLVQADRQAIGKYLKINIDGDHIVTATKEKSNQVFTYDKINDEHKVGAGTVLLQAFATEGWEFVEWTGSINSLENPVNFKTVKYAEINAIFRVIQHTITVSVIGDGTVTPSGDLNGDVLVDHGADIEFTFAARLLMLRPS